MFVNPRQLRPTTPGIEQEHDGRFRSRDGQDTVFIECGNDRAFKVTVESVRPESRKKAHDVFLIQKRANKNWAMVIEEIEQKISPALEVVLA